MKGEFLKVSNYSRAFVVIVIVITSHGIACAAVWLMIGTQISEMRVLFVCLVVNTALLSSAKASEGTIPNKTL